MKTAPMLLAALTALVVIGVTPAWSGNHPAVMSLGKLNVGGVNSVITP